MNNWSNPQKPLCKIPKSTSSKSNSMRCKNVVLEIEIFGKWAIILLNCCLNRKDNWITSDRIFPSLSFSFSAFNEKNTLFQYKSIINLKYRHLLLLSNIFWPEICSNYLKCFHFSAQSEHSKNWIIDGFCKSCLDISIQHFEASSALYQNFNDKKIIWYVLC